MAAYIQCPGAVWLLVTGISAVLPVLTTCWCVYCHCVAYFPFLVITRHYTQWVQRSSELARTQKYSHQCAVIRFAMYTAE